MRKNANPNVVISGLRGTAEMTQVEAANACGVHPSTWYRWEAGKSVPTKRMLRRIREVMTVKPSRR